MPVDLSQNIPRMANGMRKMTLLEIWKSLDPGLDDVFHMKPINKSTYMKLYSEVYSYCTSVGDDLSDRGDVGSNKKKAGGAQLKSPSNQTSWLGMELYRKVEVFLATFLATLFKELGHLRGETLLQTYSKLWEDYRFSSRVTDGMCSYLNRHWWKRERDEGVNPNVFKIYGLCLVRWRDDIFKAVEPQLIRAILDLIAADRMGETINSSLLRTSVDSILELGLGTEADNDSNLDAKEMKLMALQLYRTSLEAHLLSETSEFYTQESTSFLSQNPVHEYIKKVQTRLEEEQNRCAKYLDLSTEPSLKKVLEDVLIIRPMEELHEEFKRLLDGQKVEDLEMMYKLLIRVPSRVPDLHKIVQEHILKHGRDVLEKNAVTFAADPRAFVNCILEVYDRSRVLIAQAFSNDTGFVTAMDKAFDSLVNDNALTKGTAVTSTKKVSELLARYCDSILKKSTGKNVEETDLESDLSRVMVIFKFVEEKDVFQQYYGKQLARRLVHGASVSDDAETSMISKLKAVCGFEYTSKLQRMVQDINLSRDLNDAFRTYLDTGIREAGFDYDFGVQILSTGAWPFSPSAPMALPHELDRPLSVFKDFYNSKHSGRKLSWLYHMCKADLSTNCFKNKHIFTATAAQTCVLLAFNSQTEYTIGQLQEILNCTQQVISQALVAMIKMKVLLLTDETETVEESDLERPETLVKLNLGFKNKKMRVNLIVPVKAEQKQEEEAVNRLVDEDRKMVIQATLVRIMKMRKQLRHQQLIIETISMLSNRFKPSIPLIKKCIEILIQKDYMKRSEENRDEYLYVA